MDWHECESCETEFKVISSATVDYLPEYCPFCGSATSYGRDEDEDEDDNTREDWDF